MEMTVADIFEALGGPAEVGRAIGITTEHASSIRRRGSIPVIYWPRIITHAKKAKIKSVTYEALALAHSPEGNQNEA